MPEPMSVAHGNLPVLMVGAGPTCAHLSRTIRRPDLLIERDPSTSLDATGISLNDEPVGTLQIGRLHNALDPIIVPGPGTIDLGARVHASGGGCRFGHPLKSPLAQTDLERVLRGALDRHRQIAGGGPTTNRPNPDRDQPTYDTLQPPTAR